MENTKTQAGERTQHTPGPWRKGPAGKELAVALSVPIGSMVIAAKRENGSWDHVAALAGSGNPEANARLIAAAPELLEQLKRAVECVEYCRQKHKDAQHGTGYPIELMWKELIAKAEGK